MAARTEETPKPKRPVRRKTATEAGPAGGAQRVQRIIAASGITSRRKAEELIVEGRVRVNGVVVEIGAKADPAVDVIDIDGKKLYPASVDRVYILLNKPRGYISALSDPEGRPVVTDIVKGIKARVYPVGRLDFDAEGVLLLTNDGELSNQLIHPSHGVAKRYQVKVRGVPTKATLAKLAGGVSLEDGRTMPARAHMVRETQENSWIELTVYEGRNRLVKRMCAAVGHPVTKLKRIEFAGIRLTGLKPGEFRMLTGAEVERLRGAGGADAGKPKKRAGWARAAAPKKPASGRRTVPGAPSKKTSGRGGGARS